LTLLLLYASCVGIVSCGCVGKPAW
jgi:hypothetical protein